MKVLVEIQEFVQFLDADQYYPVAVIIVCTSGDKVAGIAADKQQLAGAAKKLLETKNALSELQKKRLTEFAADWGGGGGGFSGGGASDSW